jgi:hypothetical protein
MDRAAAPSAPELAGGPEARPRPSDGRAPAWVRLGPLVFVLVLTVGVSVRDPHEHGSWGICPTYGIFGVFCPGCGSLRALYDLVHGDIAASVGHNLLLIPAVLFVAWTTVRPPGPRWSRAWLVAVIVFTVARNLPGSPLAP